MTQSILVTGASRGIGRGIASRLASDGFDVVVHYHSNAELAQTCADEIINAGGSARTLGFDVADRQSAEQVLADDIAAHGALLRHSPLMPE